MFAKITGVDAIPTYIEVTDMDICVLNNAGEIYCMDERHTSLPYGSYVSISSMFNGMCGLRTNGSLVCVEDLEIDDDGGYIQIASGPYHVCALDSIGRIKCWGCHTNSGFNFGQCTPPINVLFTDIYSNGYSTCGITTQSTAVCWGNELITPLYLQTTEFTALSMMFENVCGLTFGGKISCWGTQMYEFGQSQIPDTLVFSQVSVGNDFICALDMDGFAHCWGNNDYFQLERPQNVSFEQISTSSMATCGLLLNGSLYCWGWEFNFGFLDGWNFYAQGQGPEFEMTTPLTSISSYQSLVPGHFDFSADALVSSPNFIAGVSNIRYLWIPSQDIILGPNSLRHASLVCINSRQPGYINLSYFQNLTLQQGFLHGLSSRARVLDIRGNMLRSLAPNFLQGAPLSLIRLYLLEGNAISTLPVGFLFNLRQIQSIDSDIPWVFDFSNRSLVQIRNPLLDNETMGTRPNVIDLSKNSFSSTGDFIEFLNPYFRMNMMDFSPSGSLAEDFSFVNISHNRLQRIGENAFTSLRLLKFLDLSYNNISFIHENAFQASRNIRLFDVLLEGNPILETGCPTGMYNHWITFASGAFFPVCKTCPVGSFCVRGVRTECPAGRYNNFAGSSRPDACNACPKGTYNERTGQSQDGCSYCPPGRANSYLGQTLASSCEPCTAGRYAETLGSAMCFDCPKGRYSSVLESFALSDCQPCPANRFGERAGARSMDACSRCPEGLTSIEGSFSVAQCTKTCPGGSFLKNGTCLDCPVGKFSTGNGDCTDCPSGFYSNRAASRECSPCPSNAYSLPGSASLEECKPCGQSLKLSDDKKSCRAQCEPNCVSKSINEDIDQDQSLFSPVFSIGEIYGLSRKIFNETSKQQNDSLSLVTTESVKDISSSSSSSSTSRTTMDFLQGISSNPSTIAAITIVAIAVLVPFLGTIKLSESVRKYVHLMDLFGDDHYWKQKQPIVYEQTQLGTFCTLSFYFVVVAISTNLLYQLLENNRMETQRLGYTDTNDSLKAFGKISLQIIAHGSDLDECPSMDEFTFLGLEKHGTGKVDAVSSLMPTSSYLNVSNSDYGNTCIFRVDCDECVFTNLEPKMSISFPWSYQSLRVILGSDLTQVTFVQTAPSSSNILTNVSSQFTVQPEVQVDETKDTVQSATGYRLFPGGVLANTKSTIEDGVLPLTDKVNVHVSFRRTDYVMESVIQYRQSWVQFFSSVLGAAAGILSIYRIAFIYYEHIVKVLASKKEDQEKIKKISRKTKQDVDLVRNPICVL